MVLGWGCRGAFIPFLVAGDPDLDTTAEAILELDRAGADVIELGVPYSVRLCALGRGSGLLAVCLIQLVRSEKGILPVIGHTPAAFEAQSSISGPLCCEQRGPAYFTGALALARLQAD